MSSTDGNMSVDNGVKVSRCSKIELKINDQHLSIDNKGQRSVSFNSNDKILTGLISNAFVTYDGVHLYPDNAGRIDLNQQTNKNKLGQ